MSINLSESDILTAIQSAQDGAFFRDEIPATNAEESIMWLEHVESQYKRKSDGAAAAPKGAEKARLVITRKSQTREILKPETSNAESLRHDKAMKLGSLYTSAALRLTPEKRAEFLGIDESECLDVETGEVRPKFVSEVEKNHFASPVFTGVSSRFDKERPSNKKPKIVNANYQKNRVHFQSRNWSNEYRVVCTQMTSPNDAPDSNTGARITGDLSSRARGKIIDSGLYMQAVKNGYNAFLTVTLDEAARKKLDEKHYKKDKGGKAGDVIAPAYSAEGDKLVFEMAENEEVVADGRFTFIKFDFATIGEQLSPFLDLIGKMHKRGWYANKGLFKEFVHTDVMHNNERVYDWGVVECIDKLDVRAITNNDMEVTRIECEQDANKKAVFDYMWVAEAPRKIHETRHYPFGENGEMVEVQSVGYQNYHAHMLMRWNVPRHHFNEWAEKIEGHWKKGMVHIERIKSPAAATSYLLKALGYMSSSSKGPQGEIRGNRYNISKYARAEKWENCATHESQHMFGLIQEYLQGLDAKRKRKQQAQKELKETIAFSERLRRVNAKEPTIRRSQLLNKIESKIELVTNKVQSIASELHGNFAVGGVAKFADGVEFKKFLDFAIGVRGWRLKTVFSNECDQQYIREQRRDENKVNDYLVKAQTMVNDSIEQVANFYSRYEPVDEYC